MPHKDKKESDERARRRSEDSGVSLKFRRRIDDKLPNNPQTDGDKNNSKI